jgi:polysaccharide export outer membrane protein
LVSVFIKEYKSKQISVLGYVKSPGIFYVTGQKTVLDLISMAGGLTADAGDICVVQRTSAADTKEEKKSENIVIDLNELLINGHYDLNIPVHASDVINIQKSGVFFVDGTVGAPGLFPLKGRVTLVQALTMAKGLNWEASRGDIRIFRENGKIERDIITVDYDAILDRKAADIDLKDKDIIIVGHNTVKGIIKGLAATLNFGMFSLGKGGL